MRNHAAAPPLRPIARTTALALFVALGSLSCGDGSAGGGAADDASAAAPEAAGAEAPRGAASVSGDTASPTRAALPALFSIMLGLQQDEVRVSRGLWLGRPDSVAAGARAIADHPAIPLDEGERIAGVLGEDMSRFQELDRKVHDLAVRLGEAADSGEAELLRLVEIDAELRAGCVECHEAFRDRLRNGIRSQGSAP